MSNKECANQNCPCMEPCPMIYAMTIYGTNKEISEK